MRQVPTFFDDRLVGGCTYCGGLADTRDHVPPRVFLDQPFPENLPVVGSCTTCNGGASLDEQYVACALEVAVAGSAEPDLLERDVIRRTLQRSPELRERLAGSIQRGLVGDSTFLPEGDRVQRVADKTARAIWRFETGEHEPDVQTRVEFCPLDALDHSRREEFLRPTRSEIFPEVGSRMMVLQIESDGLLGGHWEVVQPDRFAYLISIGGAVSSTVRMVIRGYLAVEVQVYR